MRRLSLPWTRVYKWGVPILLVVALIALLVLPWLTPRMAATADPWLTMVVPAAVLVATLVVFWVRFGKCVDEVWLDADVLRVRCSDQTAHIALTDITHISSSRFANPPWIELQLGRKSAFGDTIRFVAGTRRSTLQPFARNAVAQELGELVARARRGA